MTVPNYYCNICCARLPYSHPIGTIAGVTLGWKSTPGTVLLTTNTQPGDGHIHFCDGCYDSLANHFEELAKEKP